MKVRSGFVVAACVALVAGAVHWLPDELSATLPVTSLVATSDGQWRTAAPLGREPTRVVVHHNIKWCTCPGLGVVSQFAAANIDSAFAFGHALFRSFAEEGARDPAGRCLTVTLEAGSGRHWPWTHPALYTFSWYLRLDGRWVFQGYGVPASEVHEAHARSEAWHQVI